MVVLISHLLILLAIISMISETLDCDKSRISTNVNLEAEINPLIISDLNAQQLEAVNKLTTFIRGSNNSPDSVSKMFYLLGYAGTGKTYTISRVIGEFIQAGWLDQIFVCAPTHTALHVIESYFRTNPHVEPHLSKITFMTIHRLLEFKPTIVSDTGSKQFRSTVESKFFKQLTRKLIIVDECSMLSVDIVHSLKKYIELYPLKVVCLGDNLQLPPVSETISSIFDASGITKKIVPKCPTIVLNTVMRAKSSTIHMVQNLIRNWDGNKSIMQDLVNIHNLPENKRDFKLYHKKSTSDFQKHTWFKIFRKNVLKNKVPIILTWTNDGTDKYNQQIRYHLLDEKERTVERGNGFAIGDRVMFTDFYQSPVDGSVFRTANVVTITSIESEERILYAWQKSLLNKPSNKVDSGFNEIVRRILKCKSNFVVNTYNIERIDPKQEETISCQIQAIHIDSHCDYQEMLTEVRKLIEQFFKQFHSEARTKKMWDVYHKHLIEPYAKLNFGYSLTTHKAQGSTFDIVYVDVSDITLNKNIEEMKKILYTATTRVASELKFIV